MFLISFFCRHPHHQRPEHALEEAKQILQRARQLNEDIMSKTSLQDLKDAVAEQGTLIGQAETFINTLEAATTGGSSGGVPADTVAAADVDAVTAQVVANNDRLKAAITASAPPAPTPAPAPAVDPVTGLPAGTQGDTSGASVAGTVDGVNDGTLSGTATDVTPGASTSTGMQPGTPTDGTTS